MDKKSILQKLEELFNLKEVRDGFPSQEACIDWANKVAPLLKFSQQYYYNFMQNAHKINLPLSSYTLGPALKVMVSQVQMAIEELKLDFEETQNGFSGIDTTGIWQDGKIRVFISHKDEKKIEAKKLAAILDSFGVSSFVAHDSIQPMLTWKNEIYKALQTMEAFVCFITDDYYGSVWTNQEIGFALAKGIPIILYSHDGTDPEGFKSDIQAIKGDMNKVKLYIKRIFSSNPLIKKNILENFLIAKDGSFANAKSQFINLVGLKFTDEEIDKIVSTITGPAKYINQLGVILCDEMSEDDSKIIGYPVETPYHNVLDKEILSQHTEKRYTIIQVDKDRYEIKDGSK
ncbi:MAG: toll/interleukin-1 receptor domain-containing protein [Candidatus Omnitrophica bacterium]|nr:toll/interleukin-1 receptor domain-containing protein [Candidatus Omnitrophota bacterium]MCG2707495.1 toll/interleukin-1 receptor domain-containing protein [Candidatus Omnitrophota bacterium]